MPSPNIPTVESAVVYPGTVLFEGTNVSEGRGTTRPFELVGSAGVAAERFADALSRLELHHWCVLQARSLRADVPQVPRQNELRRLQDPCPATAHRFQQVLTGVALLGAFRASRARRALPGAIRPTSTRPTRCQSTSSRALRRFGKRSTRGCPPRRSRVRGNQRSRVSTRCANVLPRLALVRLNKAGRPPPPQAAATPQPACPRPAPLPLPHSLPESARRGCARARRRFRASAPG